MLSITVLSKEVHLEVTAVNRQW